MLEAFAMRYSTDKIITDIYIKSMVNSNSSQPPVVTREDLYNYSCCNENTRDIDDYVKLLNYGFSFIDKPEELSDEKNFDYISNEVNFTNSNFYIFSRLIPSMLDRFWFYNNVNYNWWSEAYNMTDFYGSS